MDFYSTTEGTTSNDEATAEQSANVASPLPPQSRPYDYPKSYDQTEPLTTPHTITVLMLLLGGVFYVFQTHEDDSDAVANVKLYAFCFLPWTRITCLQWSGMCARCRLDFFCGTYARHIAHSATSSSMAACNRRWAVLRNVHDVPALSSTIPVLHSCI